MHITNPQTVKPIRLFQRLWFALSKPQEYINLYHQTSGRTLITLLLFCLLTSLATSVSIAFWINQNIPATPQFVADLKTDLRNLYPLELKVNIVQGKLSMNQKAPYVIDMPSRWQEFLKSENPTEEQLPHLVTIDPTAKVEDYEARNSLVLLTERSIVYPSKSQNTGSDKQRFQTSFATYASQPETANVSMDYQKYLALETGLEPYLDKIPAVVTFAVVAFVLIVPWIVGLFAWVGAFIYLLFGTLVVWIVSAVMKRPYTYGQLYSLGIYGVMLPLLVKTLLSVFGVTLPMFGFTLMYAIWMGVVLKNTPSLGTVTLPTNEPPALTPNA